MGVARLFVWAGCHNVGRNAVKAGDYQRLLICLVVATPRSSLRWTLERIPASVFGQYDCEILVVDDGSEDRVRALQRECHEIRGSTPLTLLRNDFNRGYGGSQKMAYAHAMAEGFDFVAVLHCDGRHAPEELPRLLQALLDGKPDVVIGSRIMQRSATRFRGMPLLNGVATRVLTAVQNALLGTRLSDLHSGYRIYAVRALRCVPFRLNTDDFHFDTEIIIQLVNAKAHIVEVPVESAYGEGMRRLRGAKYVKDVVATTLRNTIHRAGLLYRRRFDPLTDDNSHYGLKLGYPSSHSWALARVPPGATVLDIGSGPGDMANELLKKGCNPAMADQFAPETSPPGIPVFVQDLDEPLTFDVRDYEYLLLLDILEHLKDPARFLERLRRQFDHETKMVIVTTPNIAFVVQRLMLIVGQFNYGKAGILDRTHNYLLTFRGAMQLLLDAGFRVRKVRGVPAPFRKVLPDGVLARGLTALNLGLIRLSKTLFSYQIYVEAESTPDMDFLLREAKLQSQLRAAETLLDDAEIGAGDEASSEPQPFA